MKKNKYISGFNCAAEELKNGTWNWGLPSDNFELNERDYDYIKKLSNNDLYKRSKNFRLSTSQVASIFPDSFMCYGPLVPNGYGCCYNPTKDQIVFALSAFNINNGNTNVQKYKSELENTLLKMKEMSTKLDSKL